MEKDKVMIYDVSLEDWHEGVFATSLVEHPATLSNVMFFDKQGETKIMYFADQEKREIVGAVMIPDLLIPRVTADGQKFEVRFSKEVISALNDRMKEYGYDKSFTFAHKYQASNTVKLQESWIKEFDEDKSNAYGFDLPIGTLFAKAKIEDDLLWNLIKENKLNGFSIELDADFKLSEESKKEKEMSKLEMFDSNIVVGEKTIAFDGESMETAPMLFEFSTTEVDGKEVEKMEKMTAEFEHENKMFSVVGGIATVTEKVIEPETPEVVAPVLDTKALMTDIGALIDGKLEAFSATMVAGTKVVEEKVAEVALFQKQNVHNVKAEGEGDVTPEPVKVFEKANASAKWLSDRSLARKAAKK